MFTLLDIETFLFQVILSVVIKKICSNMDAMFDICYLATSDGNNVEPDDIPKTKENVWILGKKYSAIQGEFVRP